MSIDSGLENIWKEGILACSNFKFDYRVDDYGRLMFPYATLRGQLATNPYDGIDKKRAAAWHNGFYAQYKKQEVQNG